MTWTNLSDTLLIRLQTSLADWMSQLLTKLSLDYRQAGGLLAGKAQQRFKSS